MAQSAVVRWANPAKILVATNLLEGQTLILHAIDQAMLSRASVLLVHVIGPSSLRVDSPMDTACVVPSFTLQSVKAKLDEAAREFQRAGILCESVILGGLPTTQISLLVRSRDIRILSIQCEHTTHDDWAICVGLVNWESVPEGVSGE